MHFKKHILTYILVPLLILFCSSSYLRFMIDHDHLVLYETDCDPLTESCYLGCEEYDNDGGCSAEYSYALIERSATSLIALCGNDITECEAANSCQNTDQDCSVIYCDPLTEADLCSTLAIPAIQHEQTGQDENTMDSSNNI